mgnify:CR=1 FL=1
MTKINDDYYNIPVLYERNSVGNPEPIIVTVIIIIINNLSIFSM